MATLLPYRLMYNVILGYAILFMIIYPNVQKKIHEELDLVIGNDRFITLDDKPLLHYLCATCQVKDN